MESNANINTENTTVEQTQVEESTNGVKGTEPSTAITYTEEEVASRISSAVNRALQKAKQNSDKSNAEIANELAELKAELAREKNMAFVATEVTKNNIPSDLTDLFYAEDNDISASRIKKFTKWWSTALDAAVDARLNATETPQFGANQPGVSSVKQPVTTFAQFLEQNK